MNSKQMTTLTIDIDEKDCAQFTARFGIIIVGHNQDAILECRIENTPFVGFYDNNGTKIIEKEDRYKFVRNPGDPNLISLEIFNVLETDFGQYTCGDSLSNATVKLEIKVTIPVLKSLFKLAIGDPGIVEAVVYAMPKYPISWVFKKSGTNTPIEIAKLSNKGEMIKGGSLYDISIGGALTIKKVSSEHAGEYQIVVSDGSSRQTRSTTVEVGEKPILTETPKKMYSVTQFLNLKIPCEWSGKSSETWSYLMKNGTEIELTENVDQTGIFLENVTRDDEGTYFCKAKNEYGSSIFKTELKQVIIPATLTGMNREYKAAADREFSFMCQSTGIPDPNIIVSKKQRDGSFTTIKQGVWNVTVTFPSVQVSHKGIYRCQAENGAQSKDGVLLKADQTISIDVLTVPTISMSDTTAKVTSAVGLKFSVKCVAQGNPNPNVTLSMGKDIYASNYGNGINGIVTAEYTIAKAVPNNFGKVTCNAKNTQGDVKKDIEIFRVIKANPPGGLIGRGVPGLEYIDLKWNNSQRADSYFVYVNDTRKEPSWENSITITGLKRSTFYKFEVAAVNLAGVGNRSKSIILKTSDINRPAPVSEIEVEEVTSVSAIISWKGPSNIAVSGMLTYQVQYCTVTNTSTPVCRENKESKDRRAELSRLERGTTYRIKIIAINQGVKGEEASKELTTKNTKPPPPSKSGKTGGLSSGAIAGVIIAIILIILIVIDLFCCFFNNCGFSHCCFETFCASKSKKYAPADSKDEEEVRLKQQNEAV